MLCLPLTSLSRLFLPHLSCTLFALQAFLRTYGRGMRPPTTGADDAQADCIARLAPLVALFAGDERLMQLTAAVTRVTQDTAPAVAWACAGAAVLERLVGGEGAAAAVRATVEELQQGGPGKTSFSHTVWMKERVITVCTDSPLR